MKSDHSTQIPIFRIESYRHVYIDIYTQYVSVNIYIYIHTHTHTSIIPSWLIASEFEKIACHNHDEGFLESIIYAKSSILQVILIFPLQLFWTQYVLPCLAGEKADIFENRSTLLVPSPKHQGRRHTRPLLISLAPLTNVALALNLEPKLPQLCPVPWDEQRKHDQHGAFRCGLGS